jgi:hypothetical protein
MRSILGVFVAATMLATGAWAQTGKPESKPKAAQPYVHKADSAGATKLSQKVHATRDTSMKASQHEMTGAKAGKTPAMLKTSGKTTATRRHAEEVTPMAKKPAPKK